MRCAIVDYAMIMMIVDDDMMEFARRAL